MKQVLEQNRGHTFDAYVSSKGALCLNQNVHREAFELQTGRTATFAQHTARKATFVLQTVHKGAFETQTN